MAVDLFELALWVRRPAPPCADPTDWADRYGEAPEWYRNSMPGILEFGNLSTPPVDGPTPDLGFDSRAVLDEAISRIRMQHETELAERRRDNAIYNVTSEIENHRQDQTCS